MGEVVSCWRDAKFSSGMARDDEWNSQVLGDIIGK